MTERRKTAVIIALILLAMVGFALVGCAQPSGLPPINIINNNSNSNTTAVTIVYGSPVPSEAPGCLAIARIRVEHPASLRVGQSGPLSATPLGTDGKERGKACDEADGLSWHSSSTPGALVVTDSKAFVTTVTGKQAGTHTLTVLVGNAEGSVQIPVSN